MSQMIWAFILSSSTRFKSLCEFYTYSKIFVVRVGGGGGSHLSTHTGNTTGINACKDLKKTGKELISIYGNSSSGISNSISSMRFCFSFSVSGLCLAALPWNKIYLKHSDKILICFYANTQNITIDGR